MSELINKILDFFSNERISLAPKITIPALAIIGLFLFIDYYGFFYYYANGKKVNYIAQLEETRGKCTSDTLVTAHLNDMMNKAINRKNAFQWFATLFENTKGLDEDVTLSKPIENTTNNQSDKNWIEEWFPPLERNQLWHTLTSTTLLLLGLVFCVLYTIILPFITVENKLSTFIGMFFIIGLLVLLTWFFQWVMGLIPPLGGRAYINYAIQIILQILLIVGFSKLSKTSN